ncbi:hypothetical protein HYC85_030010 [Camellia sinensis]|uniref:Nucleoplasmin-like domain-containing protein n=1 Tax=Camellia sinensis TaxID=4442 RepID=A0A7J7FZP4_CAMSI|nr:hypothetical protein HYC85_030010 [Camellia sinensis]
MHFFLITVHLVFNFALYISFEYNFCMLLPGVEVKAGQPLKVNPEVGSVIHISQAALGEGKKGKGNDIVPLQVNINGKKLVLGSLSAGKFPQVSFDLVFEKEFELSHDWKDGRVYFCGYSADNQFEYPLHFFLVSCAVDFSFAVINVFISIFTVAKSNFFSSVEPAQPDDHRHDDELGQQHNPQLLTHSVTRLRGTGISLRKRDSLKITDIGFDKGKGKLLIPPLRIHGSTKSIFLNLMAFEQCYHRERDRYITSYISFMDRLIDSVRDVQCLQKKGIIVHDLGSEEDVATLFNNLRKEIVVPTNTNSYYLANVSCDLNRYYTKWRNWWGILKHEYVKDPWKILSIVAAILIILLTSAQTIYTILGYYPRRK